MKTLKSLLLIALMVVAATPAHAISLRFKFKVFSSGPSIYACNAGITHVVPNKKVCYFEGTMNSCTAGSCADTACNTRCICSGTNGGDYLMDYMKVSYADWADNGADANQNVVTTTRRGSTSAAQVFGAGSSMGEDESWKHSLRELSFNLGSELYGAQYFIDVCYRGSQIEYFADNVTSRHTLTAQTNLTDFFQTSPNPGDNSRDGLVIPGKVDGKAYSELSNLQVQAYTVCDAQGQGTYKFAHDGSSAANGTYNTTKNEANFVFGSNGMPTGGGDAGKFFSSSRVAVPVSTNVTNLFSDTVINGDTVNAPRFCKVRYVFTETNAMSTTPYLRKWQRHGAEVCTLTTIEESN